MFIPNCFTLDTNVCRSFIPFISHEDYPSHFFSKSLNYSEDGEAYGSSIVRHIPVLFGHAFYAIDIVFILTLQNLFLIIFGECSTILAYLKQQYWRLWWCNIRLTPDMIRCSHWCLQINCYSFLKVYNEDLPLSNAVIELC